MYASGPDIPADPFPGNLRVGVDMVRISRIAESVERFGQRFLQRIFTADEIAYAMAAPACRDERLAARFAAKEAALKALQLADQGIRWTDLEVARDASGDCSLRLHGAARGAAASNRITDVAVSLSHEGDYATAVVMARRRDAD
jgi:holo-[acyl-carrier protein] synthase